MHISITIPAGIKQEVDALAEQLDRSRSWVITTAVEGYLERQREIRRRIREAAAEADAHPEQLVSHDEAMQRLRAKLRNDTNE